MYVCKNVAVISGSSLRVVHLSAGDITNLIFTKLFIEVCSMVPPIKTYNFANTILLGFAETCDM